MVKHLQYVIIINGLPKKWLPSSGSLMDVSLWQLIYKGVVITERLTMER